MERRPSGESQSITKKARLSELSKLFSQLPSELRERILKLGQQDPATMIRLLQTSPLFVDILSRMTYQEQCRILSQGGESCVKKTTWDLTKFPSFSQPIDCSLDCLTYALSNLVYFIEGFYITRDEESLPSVAVYLTSLGIYITPRSQQETQFDIFDDSNKFKDIQRVKKEIANYVQQNAPQLSQGYKLVIGMGFDEEINTQGAKKIRQWERQVECGLPSSIVILYTPVYVLAYFVERGKAQLNLRDDLTELNIVFKFLPLE